MFKKISILLTVVLLSSCAITDVVVKTAKILVNPDLKVGEDKDQPAYVSLSINAALDANVNLYSEDDIAAKGTPLSFKILQLKDDSLFKGADFESINKDLEGVLKSSYIDHEDYEIEPGDFKFIELFKVDEDTHFIAVVASYNNYQKIEWKSLTKIKPYGNKYRIHVQFDTDKVEIKREGERKDKPAPVKKPSIKKGNSARNTEIELIKYTKYFHHIKG
jgi:type VI secretion system protein VasD